jgi:SAM-dependent methyltransferase
MTSEWIAYNKLAWVDDLLSAPDEYENEAGHYISLIKSHCPFTPETMLHLGSGAGGIDKVFKRHFSVTGVDLSHGMLLMARALHPDIAYIEGDMRDKRLGRMFDVVAIPDSIDYMATTNDLNRAIETATLHLKPDGILLVVGKTSETFQNNSFVYTGEKDGINITVFENNYINPLKPYTYEAVLIYLIREHDRLNIYTDHHILGLFSQAKWEEVFSNNGLNLTQSELDGVYDPYLLNDGSYPMQIFIGLKQGELK